MGHTKCKMKWSQWKKTLKKQGWTRYPTQYLGVISCQFSVRVLLKSTNSYLFSRLKLFQTFQSEHDGGKLQPTVQEPGPAHCWHHRHRSRSTHPLWQGRDWSPQSLVLKHCFPYVSQASVCPRQLISFRHACLSQVIKEQLKTYYRAQNKILGPLKVPTHSGLQGRIPNMS